MPNQIQTSWIDEEIQRDALARWESEGGAPEININERGNSLRPGHITMSDVEPVNHKPRQ